MPDYITRDEFQRHLEDNEDRIQTLTHLQAEVMGDVITGRPSLRVELTNQITEMDMKLDEREQRTDKRLRFITRIATGILMLIVLKVIGDWFGLDSSRVFRDAQHIDKIDQGK